MARPPSWKSLPVRLFGSKYSAEILLTEPVDIGDIEGVLEVFAVRGGLIQVGITDARGAAGPRSVGVGRSSRAKRPCQEPPSMLPPCWIIFVQLTGRMNNDL